MPGKLGKRAGEGVYSTGLYVLGHWGGSTRLVNSSATYRALFTDWVATCTSSCRFSVPCFYLRQ
jgi:hypothetical protein